MVRTAHHAALALQVRVSAGTSGYLGRCADVVLALCTRVAELAAAGAIRPALSIARAAHSAALRARRAARRDANLTRRA